MFTPNFVKIRQLFQQLNHVNPHRRHGYLVGPLYFCVKDGASCKKKFNPVFCMSVQNFLVVYYWVADMCNINYWPCVYCRILSLSNSFVSVWFPAFFFLRTKRNPRQSYTIDGVQVLCRVVRCELLNTPLIVTSRLFHISHCLGHRAPYCRRRHGVSTRPLSNKMGVQVPDRAVWELGGGSYSQRNCYRKEQ